MKIYEIQKKVCGEYIPTGYHAFYYRCALKGAFVLIKIDDGCLNYKKSIKKYGFYELGVTKVFKLENGQWLRPFYRATPAFELRDDIGIYLKQRTWNDDSTKALYEI